MTENYYESDTTHGGSETVVEFIAEQANNVHFPEAQELVVAAKELVSNVCRYAYPPGCVGKISAECLSAPESHIFQIIIRDNGKPFNPVTWKEGKNYARVSICGNVSSGMGILIARRYMSELRYVREGGQNILTATKYY